MVLAGHRAARTELSKAVEAAPGPMRDRAALLLAFTLKSNVVLEYMCSEPANTPEILSATVAD